jgi:uncharacterized protein (DUF433 family)
MASTASARIVTELHDEPHIEGRRITVKRIQGLVEGADKSATTVAEELQVDLSDVYAALHYYHTHPDEMEAVERQRTQREQEVLESKAKTVGDYKPADEENGTSDSD